MPWSTPNLRRLRFRYTGREPFKPLNFRLAFAFDGLFNSTPSQHAAQSTRGAPIGLVAHLPAPLRFVHRVIALGQRLTVQTTLPIVRVSVTVSVVFHAVLGGHRIPVPLRLDEPLLVCLMRLQGTPRQLPTVCSFATATHAVLTLPLLKSRLTARRHYCLMAVDKALDATLFCECTAAIGTTSRSPVLRSHQELSCFRVLPPLFPASIRSFPAGVRNYLHPPDLGLASLCVRIGNSHLHMADGVHHAPSPASRLPFCLRLLVDVAEHLLCSAIKSPPWCLGGVVPNPIS